MIQDQLSVNNVKHYSLNERKLVPAEHQTKQTMIRCTSTQIALIMHSPRRREFGVCIKIASRKHKHHGSDESQYTAGIV